jgi:hypothetical protein
VAGGVVNLTHVARVQRWVLTAAGEEAAVGAGADRDVVNRGIRDVDEVDLPD